MVSVVAVAWSPDGTRLAAVGSQDKDIVPGWQGWVFVLESGVPPRQFTDDSVNPAGGFVPITLPPELRWTPDDREVFIGDRRGQSYLCSVPAEGGELRMVAGGGALFGAVTFDGAAQQAVVLATSPSSAGDLHLVDLGDGSQQQLTVHNEEFLREHPPARQEKWVFSRGKLEIECRLYLPPDHDPART